MEWITERPKETGCYWIYTQYRCGYYVMPMEVVVSHDNRGNQIFYFDIPASGYECDYLVSPETTTHYMKMVEPPPPAQTN